MTVTSPETMSNVLDKLVQDLGVRTSVCGRHGEFESRGRKLMSGKRIEVWSGCPSCKDEEAEEAGRKEAEARAALKRDRIDRMLQQTAIPPRFLDRTFDNWRASNEGQLHAIKVAMEYVANFESHLASGQGLIFSGAAGTGKSHLAAAILKGILPRHVGAYMTFMGMIRLIRETWRPDSKRSESQVITELGALPLLVLDEIGVQYGTEAEHTLLFEVMDRRYRDQKPTLLLSNQDKDGFKRFVGDRVYDRLTETSRWVSFDWASYRVQARKEHAR